MRFAAIDVGSNASRLHIVEANEPGHLSPYRALRIPVRLGHSVFQTGRLDAETLEASVAAMRRFAATMEEARVERYRAVVTASARSAENADELIHRTRDEAGIRLDVVDGSEEARLVALAVSSKVPLAGHCLLADLGGGSFELSESDDSTRGFMVSLPIGTVRLLEAFLSGGEPVDPRQDRLVREYVDRLLAPHRRKLRRRPWDKVIGTGGNFVALAQLCPAAGDGPAIDLNAARALLAEMGPLSAAERALEWSLNEDRADVIVEEQHRGNHDVSIVNRRLGQIQRSALAVPIGRGVQAQRDIVGGKNGIGTLNRAFEVVVERNDRHAHGRFTGQRWK